METSAVMVTEYLFLLSILSSTVSATIVGFVLGWIKESFQKKTEIAQRQYEILYGPLTYHLLSMKVLKLNRQELLDEISKEPIAHDVTTSLKKFDCVNPLIEKWNNHKDKLIKLLEDNSGYIKSKHIKLIEDFLDGCVKRDITQNGTSIRTTKERIDKMLDAVQSLQSELL